MTMTLVPATDWLPSGIDDLEPEAWRALRHSGSTCVVAGPGAGKTEFLAQRAAYLLETGICPAPYRVLAISFKSDAARNLAERVRKRCPKSLSHRFSSLTFDAFTKSLVDRFQTAIPNDWRPSRPYCIAYPNRRMIERFLVLARMNAPQHWQAPIIDFAPGTFESNIVGSYRLPVVRSDPLSAADFAIQRWWSNQIDAQPESNLSFVSINRLAELLLRAGPHIRRALQHTYPFVLVDEFQDTTYAQYDFLLSAFGGGDVAVTAVGDDKQRIMTWAGARTDSFERLTLDFAAIEIPLRFNFRSSPELVRIQHVVARALDAGAAQTVARVPSQIEDSAAQVWISETKVREASFLAKWIADDMIVRDRLPRDYAVLVRQKSDDFEIDLAPAFAQHGLRLRNESHVLGSTTLQDLLSDEFTGIAIALLRLGAKRRHPAAWQLVSTALSAIRAVAPDDDMAATRVETELTAFTAALRDEMSTTPPAAESAVRLLDRVVDFLDLKAFARAYTTYATGELLAILLEAFKLHLAVSAEGTDGWNAALDAFEGVAQIPLMTVHKSKGLEYDTIVFVGLDDQAWWAHSPGDVEGLATFFVALSRAKQRAVFAFCQQRGQRRRVAELYELLANSGVQEIEIERS